MRVTRPVLRYHGGKWRLAPWILSHFPKHRIYTEGYGGAGSVLFQKSRCYSEVYNDLDDSVVNVFRVLREPTTAARLAELLALTPFSRAEWVLAHEQTDEPVERARRTIVRSFAGFGSDSTLIHRNTGFRSNCNRMGTTPAVDWSRYPDHIRAFTSRLSGVLIDSKPALDVLREHDGSRTLHYVDPPYPLSVRSTRRGYNFELTDDDHRDLATVLRSLRGHVVLSGYPCELYDRELYPDWIRVERPTVVFRQKKCIECLWLSPSMRIRQASLFGD